jgi:hypothetical protein
MFTDISLCNRTQIAAYAVWAKADGRTLRYGALFKTPMSDVNDAESRAIVNGVVIVLRTIQPETGSKIIAQTDSLSAIRLLEGKSETAVLIKSKLQAAGVVIEYRHVKGHKGNATPRNAVNTWCDRECGRLMRQARQAMEDTQC